MSESRSPYWWLNSGAILDIKNGYGSTNQGNLSKFSRFRLLYSLSNPRDTDGGYHPQNIFRLVTKNEWRDFEGEVLFRIIRDNLSQSPNRNISNGVLFFLRYLDGNNLYYAGARVDGTVVIKKKMNGEYFTLAQKKVFPGTYQESDNPNLLPKNVWLGLKSDIQNRSDGSVLIRLFLKKDKWDLVLEVVDKPNDLDGSPILSPGHSGLRTDFMDVEFRDFKVTEKAQPSLLR